LPVKPSGVRVHISAVVRSPQEAIETFRRTTGE
jgi:hypothetical protein